MGGGSSRDRFSFIDQFRGLIGIMMALGHSSGYFNSLWKSFDMFDPTFASWGQFGLRYMGYLCAPGFLMMNGAVSWYSFTRRRGSGASLGGTRWHLIERGLFLIAVQVIWVNHSWNAFKNWNLAHIGIIATIGMSMILLAFLHDRKWWIRLGVALAAFIAHPILMTIKYEASVRWQEVLMQTFIDAGDWNKFPLLPWFCLACMGSVMAQVWFYGWKTPKQRIAWSWGIGLGALLIATLIRLGRGWGNSTGFWEFGHISFFLDSKYPPNLFHNIWFFGTVSFMVGTMHFLGQFMMPAIRWLGIVGRVPLFFYCLHIPILAFVAKRLNFYYWEGAVAASFIGWVALLAVMIPLSIWFGRVKARTTSHLIKMI